MRKTSSILSPLDDFPCKRIDKCKWSLLDETIGKYEGQKKIMGRNRRSWKSRRITVNSQLDDSDMNLVEPQACLHSFKRPNMDTKETERLILTGNSYAAVVESSKEYGGGKWVIKVHGTVLSGEKNASKRNELIEERPEGDWLLQFIQLDRMQVWLKHLKALIHRVKEIEYAFRRGHTSFRPMTATSCRGREKIRLGSSDQHNCDGDEDSGGNLSDSVEELVNSTESFEIRWQHSPGPKSQLNDNASTAKEESRSSSRLTVNSDRLRPKSKLQTKRSSISSIRSQSSLRSTSLLQVAIPPSTPIQLTRSISPFSHYLYTSSQASSCRIEEDGGNPWNSPLSSSTAQSQCQSSLSSPTTSIDTRSSVSSHSSPKSLLNHYNTFNIQPKRKDLDLRLEVESLRPTISSQLSFDPCSLDSPTDPETKTTMSTLEDYDNSLLLTSLKAASNLLPYQPRSIPYDVQIGLAI